MAHNNDDIDAPLPYCGEELERLENLGRPWQRQGYGTDQRARVYRFNRLGFRGDEFDPDARHRVFAFGESHAFGYHVDFEESWPYRFTRAWRQREGLEPADVCFLSFANPGASNAAIARAVISQCSAVRPELVLVHFADLARTETLLRGRQHRVGHWLTEESALEAARNAPAEAGGQETLLELIARGKSFYRFALGADESSWFDHAAIDPTCLLAALRDMLLVQSFCKAEGIRLVATCDQFDLLFAPEVSADPTLGPLVRAIDPTVLCDFGIRSLPGDHEDPTTEHAGASRHAGFAEAMFAFYRQGVTPPEIVSARTPAVHYSEDPVRAFYETMPFNLFDTVQEAAESICTNPIFDTYPDLHQLLVSGHVRRVVDCGCGTGWLINALALHYGVEVTGVDFTPPALARAREVARRLGIADKVQFVHADLASFADEAGFDLVVSMGVLHHTADPQRTFVNVSRLIRPGGHLYLGLYHAPGRRPFLDHFQGLLAREGEEAALTAYRRFHPPDTDDQHVRSWFRDQVQHPRETQHTLREVAGWLEGVDFDLLSTSINRFRPVRDREALYRREASFEKRALRALRKRRLFPGFFTVMARRAEAHPQAVAS